MLSEVEGARTPGAVCMTRSQALVQTKIEMRRTSPLNQYAERRHSASRGLITGHNLVSPATSRKWFSPDIVNENCENENAGCIISLFSCGFRQESVQKHLNSFHRVVENKFYSGMYETMIYQRLQCYLKGRSTTHALIDVFHHWNEALDNGKSVRALFVDAKAFDHIDHSTVLKKLRNYGVPIFTARRYASAVLAVIVCPSVRPSVRHKSELYKDG